jgi:hypothetical protein
VVELIIRGVSILKKYEIRLYLIITTILLIAIVSLSSSVNYIKLSF